VLARVHDLEQRGVLGGEAHVGLADRGEALHDPVPRAVDRAGHLRAEPLEARLRERVEQRLAVGEVPAGRGVADADLAGELAQRERLHAAALERVPPPPASARSAGCRGGRTAAVAITGKATAPCRRQQHCCR
jgi:hypothetical protein